MLLSLSDLRFFFYYLQRLSIEKLLNLQMKRKRHGIREREREMHLTCSDSSATRGHHTIIVRERRLGREEA